MADCLESVFISEFRGSSVGRGRGCDIYRLPLDPVCRSWGVSGASLLLIRGLGASAGLFSGLEGAFVRRVPSGSRVAKRRIDIVTRDFIRDTSGGYVFDEFKVPSESLVIVSDINLKLPYKYKCPDGYGYIDFSDKKGKREFLYIVPKVFLYPVNQTALALSIKTMKNYSGMGSVTWRFGTVFLHVIPYKSSISYTGTKLLKTGVTLDYNKEVKTIVDFWVNSGIIPNIQLCNTAAKGNLVLKPTNRAFEYYNPFEKLSLGDREVYGCEEEVSD